MDLEAWPAWRFMKVGTRKTDGWEGANPWFGSSGREPSSGRLISTAGKHTKSGRISGRHRAGNSGESGADKSDLDYRGRGCAEDEEDGKPWSLSQEEDTYHSNLALQNGVRNWETAWK